MNQTRITSFYCLCFLVLTLVGCAGMDKNAKVAGDDLDYDIDINYVDSDQASIPTSDKLYKDNGISSQYRAVGLVLLNKSKDLVSRNYDFCLSYLGNLNDSEAYSARFSEILIMPTYWMIVLKESKFKNVYPNFGVPRDTGQMCHTYISFFDHSRAALYLSKIGKLSAEGPILIAFTTTTIGKDQLLIFDLSNFDTYDFDRAMRIWKDRITRHPSVWNDGFNLVKVREEFRNLIQKYGEQIISVLES